MLEGELEQVHLGDILSYCSLCGGCEAVCPNGVSFIEIMLEARRNWGKQALKKRFLDLLTKHRFFNAHLILSLILRIKPDLLPFNLRGKSFLSSSGGVYGKGREKRAFLFLGCLTNLFFHSTAEAAIEILLKGGYEVHVPPAQICCGFPYLSIGYREEFERFKAHNLAVIEKAKPHIIVSPCPTGAFTLRKFYGIKEAMDLVEFIWKEGLHLKARKLDLTTTWHDPCHLRNELKVEKQPREILKEISSFQEMEDAAMCCGLGGSFILSHPEISFKINRIKAEKIKASAAEVLTTACPGCIIFLSMGSDKKVVHIGELLVKALK